jgi:hypothetical protein
MTPDRGVEQGHRGGIVQWWVLIEALVWAVVIEVLGVLVEDGKGVALVVDQQPVGALVADAANEPFGVAVRSGCPGGTVKLTLIMIYFAEADTRYGGHTRRVG